MQNLKDEFKTMKDVEFPQELHGRIMRSIYLRQFKIPLITINTLLFINLSISSWHLWRALKEQIYNLAGNNLGLSEAYTYFMKAIQVVPAATTGFFIVNLVLLSVGLYVLMRLNYILTPKRDI